MINYYCLQNNWSTCFPHNVMMQAELQHAGTTGTQYPSIDGRYSLPSKRKTVTCENIQHWSVFTFSAKYISKLLFDFPKVFYIQQHQRLCPRKRRFAWCGETPSGALGYRKAVCRNQFIKQVRFHSVLRHSCFSHVDDISQRSDI